MEEKTNHYFYELPTGYKEDYVIDAKDKKIGLIFNLVCILVTIGVPLSTASPLLFQHRVSELFFLLSPPSRLSLSTTLWPIRL